MATQGFFGKWFSKKGDMKVSGNFVNSDISFSKEKEDDEVPSNTRRLWRTRSGRMREVSKKRAALTQETFSSPECGFRQCSEPSENDLAFAGRELTARENARLSRSLNWFTNSHYTENSGQNVCNDKYKKKTNVITHRSNEGDDELFDIEIS